jgi:hypothetical protein
MLCLLGPFVDSQHAMVASGLMEDSFQEVFKKQVTQLAWPTYIGVIEVALQQFDVQHFVTTLWVALQQCYRC